MASTQRRASGTPKLTSTPVKQDVALTISKKPAMKLKSFVCSSLLALSLVGPLSVACLALAEEFKADVPQIDNLPTAPAQQTEPTTDPNTAESKVLSGSVSALGRAEAQEKAGQNDSDIYNPSENNLRATSAPPSSKALWISSSPDAKTAFVCLCSAQN